MGANAAPIFCLDFETNCPAVELQPVIEESHDKHDQQDQS